MTTPVSLSNWWARARWRLYGPVYDWVATPLDGGRARAIDNLDLEPGDSILIVGSGTGIDLEYLPDGATVTAVDFSPAMVRRTAGRGEDLDLDVDVRVGDAQSLPFEDDAFDAVLLHLILTVVPDPEAVVAEADRVLDPDGRVSIYDKFVPAGSRPSLLRRALNPVARFLFSDLTRNLDPMLADTTLAVQSRESVLSGLYTVALVTSVDDEPGATDDETGQRSSPENPSP